MCPKGNRTMSDNSQSISAIGVYENHNLFVGQGTVEAEGQMGARCVALHRALLNHNIKHEYYVGGYAGHDWATWRHLLYYRFLPNLWRNQ
jgi:enterochelin esterase-like enzyme